MLQELNVNEQVDPNKVESMLASELNQMTFQEREQVCEELHGVEKPTNETEALLTTTLTAMDLALQRVPNRAIYEKAKNINARYVEDRSFRLMFLRSEYYNAERAASRLVNFLENKVKFFGEETLARPIYLSDLDKDDIAVLKSGILQLIPARDRSDRAILSDFNMNSNVEQPKHMNNYMKTLIYIVLAAAEDEETQKRGLIGMLYFTDALSLIQRLNERRGPRLFDWLPIKVAGIHFCYKDPRFRILQALLLLMMGKERRARVRMHEVLAAAEDEETQKRGLIGVFYFTNALSLIQRLNERRGPRLFDWLPIKLVGMHFCFNDPRFRILQALLLLIIGKERRVRVRMHEGTHTECQYKLMTFGIPVNCFPVGYEGELKTAAHLKWLGRRVVKETALQSVGIFEGIDLPCNGDVLLGRGKTFQDHSGNVALRSLIAEYMPEYRHASKKEKGNVAWKVMMAMKMQGGRFLKRQPNGWWVEVSDEIARDKVSMTYRTSRSSATRTVR